MAPLTIFLTRVFGVFWCLSQGDSLLLRLCSLLPRRQYAHKNHCPAHSVLISPPWDHLSQLIYPGLLLHAKALQQSVSRFAASIDCTSTNTILKIKRIRYRLIFTRLHPRTSTVLHPFYSEAVSVWEFHIRQPGSLV